MIARMKWLLLIVTVLLASGCLSRRVVTESFVTTPTYELRGVEVVEQGERGASLRAVLVIRNPNAVGLPLRVSGVSIALEGLGSYAYDAMPAVSLPPSGEQVVLLPMAVALRRGASAEGAAYALSASLSFEPPGEVRRVLTDSGVPLPVVSVSESGTVGGRGWASLGQGASPASAEPTPQ